MIATKTTALMLALGMLGIAGMMFASPSVYAQNSNSAIAANTDDDVVVQSNEGEIKQKADNSVKCDADSESGDVSFSIAANDCDENTQSTTQTASIGQANVNEDNDVQTAVADAEQSVCEQLVGLGLGLQLCGNEVE